MKVCYSKQNSLVLVSGKLDQNLIVWFSSIIESLKKKYSEEVANWCEEVNAHLDKKLEAQTEKDVDILDQIKQLDKLIAKQREMIIRSRSQFEAELDTEVFGRFLEQSIINARLICCFFCGKQHPNIQI